MIRISEWRCVSRLVLHIQVEQHSRWLTVKLEEARACAKRSYDAAVELFAMLCGKFGLDPLADGVIVSHAEGHKRGIASNHGDSEHLWRQLGLPYSMDGFRRDVKAALWLKAVLPVMPIVKGCRRRN